MRPIKNTISFKCGDRYKTRDDQRLLTRNSIVEVMGIEGRGEDMRVTYKYVEGDDIIRESPYKWYNRPLYQFLQCTSPCKGVSTMKAAILDVS